MVYSVNRAQFPIQTGKEVKILDESPSTSGSKEICFNIDSDTVIISLEVLSTSGDVDVDVYTLGDVDDDVTPIQFQVIDFPTVSAPTTELVIKKAASSLQKIRVVVTYTDACAYRIRCRGISVGETSVKFSGATAAAHSGTTIGPAATLIIPVSLADRNGVSLVNNHATGILYVGFTSGVTVGPGALAGTPVKPGGSIGLDVAAGLTVYGISDGATLDIRILEVG